MTALDRSIPALQESAGAITIPAVDQYLFFGYLPKMEQADTAWLDYDVDYDPKSGRTRSLEWWIDEGSRAFQRTMANELEGIPQNATHVVGLSGGLDSRAILQGLLDNLPRKQIVTATFGMPGSWDYELGRMVARKSGVYHQEINLLEEEWDLDRLVAAGNRLINPVNVFEAYVNQKVRDCFGADCIYWSGMSAGSLAGTHLFPEPSTDERHAVKRFLRYNQTPHFKDWAFENEIIRMILAEFPWKDASQTSLCLDMQLDFGIRQRFFIRPILLEKGYTIKTPFLDKTWLNYILHAPYPWLLDKYLYTQVLMATYPEAYKLHVHGNYGLPLDASESRVFMGKVMAKILPFIARKDPYASHPRLKYINFKEALRHPSRFQKLVYATLHDFKKRGIYPGYEIDKWWKDHHDRKADNTQLLVNLSSLEILMKAGII